MQHKSIDGGNVEKTISSSFEMPDIWNDEDEIYNLMQTFKRPRLIDPIDYDLKINFWSSLIQRYARHHNILVVNEVQLQPVFAKVFKTNGVVVRPLCLGRVLGHLHKEGRLVDISQFESRSIGWQLLKGFGWVLSTPLRWSFAGVSSLISSTEQSVSDEKDIVLGDFVLVDLVSDVMRLIMRVIVESNKYHISPHIDAISLTQFNIILSTNVPHHGSRTFVNDLLIRQRLIEPVSLRRENDTITVVKFARSVDAPLTNMGMSKCNKDQIAALLQLKALDAKLEADELMMQTKVDQLKNDVRRCLRTGSKEEARNYLRRGKIIEKMLERKRTQRDNVESMLVQIDVADDNMQVVRALTNAAGALKAHSIDVDSVHDAMAEISDAIADQEEINASISNLGDSNQRDLGELESELSMLLMEDDLPEREEIFIPDAPVGALSSKKEVAGHRVLLSK